MILIRCAEHHRRLLVHGAVLFVTSLTRSVSLLLWHMIDYMSIAAAGGLGSFFEGAVKNL